MCQQSLKEARAKADQFLGVKSVRGMQIMLLSATITESVKALAAKSLFEPVAVDVDKIATAGACCEQRPSRQGRTVPLARAACMCVLRDCVVYFPRRGAAHIPIGGLLVFLAPIGVL